MIKRCIKCGLDKALDEFAINRPQTGGRHSYCKPCLRLYTKARDAANADSISAKRKAHRAAHPEVYSARSKAYYEANTESVLARQRAAYAQNPEAPRKRNRERNNADRAANPERWASRRLMLHYGITLDGYHEMLESQGGLCANPGCFNEPPLDRRFDVDHDHACCSGQKSCGRCVRGLLCRQCNHALGLLRDDPKRVQGLIDYLERHQ